MTQVIHHIDLLQWFMGPARRVTGRCATLVHRGIIEVEDTAAAIVEFASGGIATIQAGTTFRPGLGVQVWVSDAAGRTVGLSEFPEGVAFTDVSTVDGDRLLGAGPATASMGDLPLAEIHDHLASYHAMQIEDFVAALREDREPAVTGLDAVRSLEIVEAIYRSSRTDTVVEIGGR
jgi:predicted dehydrogenase